MNDSIVARLLDLSPLGMIVINPAGSVIFANPSAASLIGYPKQIFPGDNLYPLLPLSAREILHAELQASSGLHHAAKNTSMGFSIQGIQDDQLEVALTHQPLQGMGGQLALIFLANVTAQKQAESAMQESDQRFYSLLEDVNDYGVFVLGTDGRVVSWSKSAETIKGYSSEDVVGKH